MKLQTFVLIASAIAASLSGCAAAPQTPDSEVCAQAGFGPDAGDVFWQCMNYVQNERSIRAQRMVAAAAMYGAIKTRSCNTYGNYTQCW
jgi:hypothetical protein